jgi:GntR family phosphonate transport system transcriptional regulator
MTVRIFPPPQSREEAPSGEALLQRGSGVSAWRQIADRIAAEIGAGGLEPGSKLPAEAALAARYEVNRHTVRRAIAALAEQGLVRASRGSGTYVEAPPLTYPISERTRFSDIVAAEGRFPQSRLLGSDRAPADMAIAQRLAIPVGDPVIRLETLGSANGVPLSRGTHHFPAERLPMMAEDYLRTASITRAFEAAGIADYLRHETRITARPARPEEAADLDIAAGRTVLIVEALNVDTAGVPIQTSTSVFAADRVEIVFGRG